MKYIFLALSLSLFQACSTPVVYKGSDLAAELERNDQQLDMITAQVQGDYMDKEIFTKAYTEQSTKNEFVKQDLYWRLGDLKTRRDSILQKADALKLQNDKLTNVIGNKKEIKSNQREFVKIQEFADVATKKAKVLFTEYQGYKTATKEFIQFVILTKNSK